MTKGIKKKDIQDFEKYARKLDEVIQRIRCYKDNAHIYVTPGELNLMADDPLLDNNMSRDKQAEMTAITVPCCALDCGDW